MDDEEELSEFRIEVSDLAFAKLSRETSNRLVVYLESYGFYSEGLGNVWWGHPESNTWVYQGRAPVGVITLLQAVAREDDVDAVLNMLEFKTAVGEL